MVYPSPPIRPKAASANVEYVLQPHRLSSRAIIGECAAQHQGVRPFQGAGSRTTPYLLDAGCISVGVREAQCCAFSEYDNPIEQT